MAVRKVKKEKPAVSVDHDSEYPFADAGDKYARSVVSGDIIACKLVKLACKRHIDDLKVSKKKDYPYRYDAYQGNRVCRFVQDFEEIKGPKAGKNIELAPWQLWIISNVFGWVHKKTGYRRYRTATCFVPRGNGKALSLDTEIISENGIKTMNEIKVGDFVFDSDGVKQRVLYKSEIFVSNDCYEIEFSTGEKVKCDSEHLWVTDSYRDRNRLKGGSSGKNWGQKPCIKTTKEIYDTISFGLCKKNHRILVSKPIKMDERSLPIDPYVLGLWLGDGSSRDPEIICSVDDVDEIFSYVYEKEPAAKIIRYKNKAAKIVISNGEYKFITRLKDLNLVFNKHIPGIYLFSSERQRLLLLQGLMDSDGTSREKRSECVFVNKNLRLINEVCFIANSLGLKANVRSFDAKINGVFVSKAYRMSFQSYNDYEIFRLKRKLVRLKQRPENNAVSKFRYIVSCKKIESVPVQCISISGDSKQYLITKGCISTHNTTLSAPLGLYMLTSDNEQGAEVFSAATTRDQARICFDSAQNMARRNEPYKSKCGVNVGAHNISSIKSASKFEALSADARSLDGLNVHFAILDELASHKTRGVYDVMLTATAKRTQSLIWNITTASAWLDGIGYEQYTYLKKLLEGTIQDDSYFGVFYSIDDEDDPWCEASYIKANPNWGISVMPDMIMNLANRAMQMPSQQNAFLQKHLNVWTNADVAWMDMRSWMKCADTSLNIDSFHGQPCFIGLDLASKVDIAAKMTLFERDGHYYAFGQYYLPEDAVLESRNSQYQGWMRAGLLTVTPGAVTDYEYIENDLIDDVSKYQVTEIPYDPHQATQLSTRMTAQGLPMVEMRPIVLNFSEPMKQLEALVLSGKFHFNGDPILTWMVSNVVAHMDHKDNLYPNKERPENKIDGVVALIMALGRAMMHIDDGGSVYEGRGLFVL